MPTFDDGEPRKLSFPLSRSVSPIVEGGDLSSPFSITPDWQTSDNDELVTITLNLTLNEFVALASALDAGRDLAYGDESIEIWKVWTRSVNTLNLCQQIADCINDVNSATRQALIEALSDTENPILPPSLADNPPNERVLGTSVNTDSILPDCNYDNVFGLCVQIADMTNTLITQMLELLEFAANTLELASIAADNIPILSESIDFALWIQSTAKSAYEATWDFTLRDSIACELFCIAISDCELSLDDIRDYFIGKSSLTMPSSVENILADLQLIFSGNLLVYGLANLLWSALAQGEKWFSFGSAAQVIRVISSFYNDPNPDWTTLCNDCTEEWCYTFDFTINNGGFTAFGSPAFGTWSASGWLSRQGTGFSQLTIYKPIAPCTITEVEIHGNYVNGNNNGNNVYIGIDGNLALNPPNFSQWSHTGTSAFTKSWTGSVSPNAQIWLGGYNTVGTGSLRITRLTLRGVGANPFGTDNC